MSLEQNYQKTITYFSQELSGIQSGRANGSLVENISIDLDYGAMPLGQVASVTIPDNQTIRIEPWDKGALSAIESAIYRADTGLVPSNQGEYLYVKIPPLTEETRRSTAKYVSSLGEDMKIRIRQARQDELKAIKREFENEEISEDQKKHREKKVDETTKKFTDQIDQMVKEKQNEVMKL